MSQSPEELKDHILKAFQFSLRYLSFRARSEKEINDYLNKKGFDPLITQQVIERLKEENLINDHDFALQWTDQRQRIKGKSKFAIKLELLQKGISQKIIDTIFNKTEDDLQVAQQYWEKKKHRFDKYTSDEHFKKAASFLQRKGYSFDIIKKVLKNEQKDVD